MAATSINSLAIVLKELGWSYTRQLVGVDKLAAVQRPARVTS